MDLERRSMRVGLTALACAAVLRVAGSGALVPMMRLLAKPEVASFLVYLETGRVVHPPAAQAPAPPLETEPAETRQEEPAVLTFSPADAALLELRNHTEHEPDLSALVSRPLNWDLRGSEPTVLIVHTHATESYTPAGETYPESSSYRTLDEGYNMVSIGERVAQVLEAGGIRVIHDKTYHDYPQYSGAYSRSRATIRSYLEQYPSICLVLDIHRDAVELSDGSQMSTSAAVAGKDSAQIMLVVGTDTNLRHPEWEENLSVAAKLHLTLEKTYPGLCRDMSFRKERFNQDLLPGSLLVEIGTAGDTRAEALTAAEALANAILTLSNGSR